MLIFYVDRWSRFLCYNKEFKQILICKQCDKHKFIYDYDSGAQLSFEVVNNITKPISTITD